MHPHPTTSIMANTTAETRDYLSKVSRWLAGACAQEFRALDLDGSGHVSIHEYMGDFLQRGLAYDEMRARLEVVRRGFRAVDADDDGRISLREALVFEKNRALEAVARAFDEELVRYRSDSESSSPLTSCRT